ncbi:hypothetical protein E2C01_049413 [Portunus trituberculatus]|uniref:Uncharacterized protein n=1 Tax=Portunus trituberculatus TaxID=210409 RepID=A0A5B7GDM7_PORTR|nr:hypothetical protein [Portunus trituberculatus]
MDGREEVHCVCEVEGAMGRRRGKARRGGGATYVKGPDERDPGKSTSEARAADKVAAVRRDTGTLFWTE